ncbi:zinc finger A20 and AN1 domain-containing stress-associated protein 7-like [Abrus precatorius]|uniref:Zinc finger A20 and AN1 domain-containing stress-associated protein 7-like n=1 Tax=Abrus precatorius TaxID=3816 RepID=A0A8B8K1W2_ABRPR|nr:zinc finger A20 and AN1 domain-containing stress-associated protein 7-like [Abrus precatorius]
MDSAKKDGASHIPSEPELCSNNCGFFGSAENQNLCSKCYRDLCIEEKHSATEPSLDLTLAVGKPSSSAEPSSSQAEPSKEVERCASCFKKVGLTGFVCKCGVTFCGTHRYPEKHQCSYDFKTAGRDAISKANPVIKADKVQRF